MDALVFIGFLGCHELLVEKPGGNVI